jgi:hypothetical protein
MSPQLVEPLKNIGGQVGSEVSSSMSSLSHAVSWEWALALGALLALPILGAFSRPVVRLALAVLDSFSAIVSAILVCISTWCVLIINYVTALARTLRPNPVLLQVLLAGVAVWGALTVIAQKSLLYQSPSVIAIGVVVATGAGLFCKDSVRRFFRRNSSQIKPRVVLPCVGAVLVAVYLIISNFLIPREDLSSCLVAGKVNPSCIKRVNAEPL